MKCSLRMLVRCVSILAIISVTIFLVAVFAISKINQASPFHISQSQYSFLSSTDMQSIQNDIEMRKQLVQKTCQQYNQSKILHSPEGMYLNRMRYDVKHRIMYCENFKIASSTWSMHLLRLNNLSTAKCHRAVRARFPALNGQARLRFLRTGTTFLVVREPFERLVSAYLDKLAQLPSSQNIQPKIFEIARETKRRFRTEKRESLIPTFPEFVKYVVATWEEAGMREESMMKLVNLHWKPIYVNCGPCKQRYDIIMKMETLSRDTQYLKQLKNLTIETDFAHHIGVNGHTSNNKTLFFFKQLSMPLKRKLLKMYKLDFELFGYDWRKYFHTL